MPSKEILSPFAMAFVKMGNANRRKFLRAQSKGKNHCDVLAEIITNPASQVIAGIWLDPQSPDGLGIRIIKGNKALKKIVDSQVAQCLPYDAIICTCPEEAEAMRQVFGDDRARYIDQRDRTNLAGEESCE